MSLKIAVPTLVLTLLLAAGAAGPSVLAGVSERCPGTPGLGSVAYARGAALHVVDLETCRDRVLIQGSAERPRWSADGRWLSLDEGGVISARGGAVRYPVGKGSAVTWAPTGDLLARATRKGGLLVGRPGERARRLLPEGWGAGTIAFAPSGAMLAVARALFRLPTPEGVRPYRQEIWTVDVRSGARRLEYSVPTGRVAPPEVASVSLGGSWILFRLRTQNSNSLAADGLPLLAKRSTGGAGPRTVVERMLLYEDFLSWCDTRLVVSAGGDRYSTVNKRLVAAGPPTWRATELSRDRSRSWISPACSPDGRLVAAAAGPNHREPRFGLERRSIWVLSRDGSQRRRLTAPPPGRTDELPRWSRDGRFILFVRSGPTRNDASAEGSLYLVRVADTRLFGPIARLGRDGNYYGHYGFGTDWLGP